MSIAISDVQRELDEIKLRVRSVEQAVKHVRTEEETRCSAELDELLAFTKDLFGDELRVVDTEDPEIPGRRYFVIEVTATGSVEELAALDDKWHQQLHRIADRNTSRFALSVIRED